jgi:glycosyltransferase involved in cell wall biosynthesis
MPIRNEADFIERSLGAVLTQDYPRELLEVLIADGLSVDGTSQIIARLAEAYPDIRVLVIENPGRIVPTGFNLALDRARGEVIIRVDGHTIVAPDYVRECVMALQSSGADNVGGRMEPVGQNRFGEAVSLVTSTPFGVGGARFHYSEYEEWVDTVYMGAWPRQVFERVGLFDEEQVRNQDDEFNYRLLERGGRILLSPNIRSRYYTRSTPRSLWRQYYQYGYWKVRVIQKHPAQMRPSQIAPPLFAGTLLLGLGLTPFAAAGRWGLALAVCCYAVANVAASALTARRAQSRLLPLLPLAFIILHFAYGLGFLMGLAKFWNHWRDWGRGSRSPPSPGDEKSVMPAPIRVLMVTSEWPTPESPFAVPFLVQQVEFLRRAGVKIEVFFFRGAKNPVNYLKAWWRFNRQYKCRRTRYDLVHAQFGQAALIPWPKLLPLVITFHGTDILGQLSPDGRMTRQGKLLVWMGRTAARFADAVIIVSDKMRRQLPTSMQQHVLPTGVDLGSLPNLTQEEARRQLGLPLDERLALFVGNPHNPLKCYAEAQRAVAVLDQRLPTRLILGWDRPHTEILALMHACDALVVTSLQEGSPTIVKEALACNLPIVSVVVGDVVQRLEGVAGCEVVSDRKPENIAAALERILRRGGRIKGRETVEQLDEKMLVDKLIGIYRSILTPAKLKQPPIAGDSH